MTTRPYDAALKTQEYTSVEIAIVQLYEGAFTLANVESVLNKTQHSVFCYPKI